MLCFVLSNRNNCIGTTALRTANLSGFCRVSGAYSSDTSRTWGRRRAMKVKALRALSRWPSLRPFTNTLVFLSSASPRRSTATSANFHPLSRTRMDTLALEGNYFALLLHFLVLCFIIVFMSFLLIQLTQTDPRFQTGFGILWGQSAVLRRAHGHDGHSLWEALVRFQRAAIFHRLYTGMARAGPTCT